MDRYASVVVLVLDRLGAGYLGPYGNTWIETPAMNRLASQSILIEHPLIDTPDLNGLYRSYWCGQHALAPTSASDPPTVAARLYQAGIATTLLTDSHTIAHHGLAGSFDERIYIQPDTRVHSATQVEQTQLARLLLRGVQWLAESGPPFLLWIHAQAMHGPWDAPLELRRQLADEEDPAPPDMVNVPCQHLDPDYDPDELLGITLSYAGQVAALDQCVGAFAEALDALSGAEDTLFIVTSSRGFPLGEHLRIGATGDVLYHELLHVPCLVRFPDGLGATVRSQTLWQPHHLNRLLLDWLACDADAVTACRPDLRALAEGKSESLVRRACMVSPQERAIRTPAWFLRKPCPTGDCPGRGIPTGSDPVDDETCELFVKPDDHWDVNNVATRCPDIVRQMFEQLAVCQQAARDGTLDELPHLPEELVERWS